MLKQACPEEMLNRVQHDTFRVHHDRLELCKVCNKPIEECICCPECGHICSLDNGELYCPFCFPRKKSYG